MANRKLKAAIQESGLKKWKIADLLGIRDDSFSRKLRHEMPEDEQNRIIDLIRHYAKEEQRDEK